MRRSISVGISVAALLVVLAQADAQANQGGRRHRGRSRQFIAGRSSTVAVRVIKSRPRSTSGMRARARLVEPLITAAAIKYQVDPYAIWVIAYNETRFRWWLVSPKGARGMMQFIPSTAKDYGLTDPFNVPAAIDAAARYVRRSSTQFGGRFDLVLASYNAGPAAVDAYLRGVRIVCRDGKVINPRGIRTGGVPPYTETRKYVSLGLKVYARASNAGVFSPEVLAQTQRAAMPDPASARSLMAAFQLNDRELDDLGGARSPMLDAGFAQAGVELNPPSRGGLTAKDKAKFVASKQPSAQMDEVFFDIHSGVRYLVREGEVVKYLGAMPDEASTSPQNSAPNRTSVVARSSFYGSRGE